MKNNSEKKEKFNRYKEVYNKFKEAWKDPRKRAGMKLLGYLIFFLVFIIMVRISSVINIDNSDNSEEKVETTTVSIESYREKQKELLENNHTINYEINIGDISYKINGTLKDNVIEGYLEEVSGIKKIVIRDNILYEVNNGIESVLDYQIDFYKINLKNIISIIENNNAYIDNKSEDKIYQYAININDVENSIYVYSNEKNIYKIIVKDSLSEYIMNFDK